jgi:hypothetical protein
MKAAAVGHGISARQALVEGAYPVCRVLEEFPSALAESAQDAGPHAVKGETRD